MQLLELGPTYRKRFERALRKTQHEATQSGVAENAVYGQVLRAVVSAKEQESISKLEKAMTKIEQSLKENAKNQQMLKENTSQVNSNIVEAFNEIMIKMAKRRSVLRKQLVAESQSKTESLQKQQEKLQELLKSVKKGLDEENALILDTKIYGEKREKKMQSITADLLKAMDDNTLSSTFRDTVFCIAQNHVYEVQSYLPLDSTPNCSNLYIQYDPFCLCPFSMFPPSESSPNGLQLRF